MRPLLAIAILLSAVAACDEGIEPDPPVGSECGGPTGKTCGAGQYCDFANNRCGSDNASGRCQPRPTACPALLVPERTCGCDQRVYSSPCEPLLAGSDLNETGTCQLDPGAFACGFRQCTRSNEYCLQSASDVGGEADDFTCRGIPVACGGSPSCACLAGQTCGSSCSGDAAVGLKLTCPGG